MEKKFKKIRELYGQSKNDVAKGFDMPQTSYANYEAGSTQKVPDDFTKKFAYRYMVNEAWLMGDEVPDRSSSISRVIGHRLAEAAERLRLPEAFLKAVCAGEVAHSDELHKLVSLTYGVAKQYIAAIDENGKQKELTTEDLLEVIQEKDKTIKNLNAHINSLNAHITRLEKQLGPTGS